MSFVSTEPSKVITPADGSRMLTRKEQQLAHELRTELGKLSGREMPPWVTDEDVLDCTEHTILRACVEMRMSCRDLMDAMYLPKWGVWRIFLGCVLLLAALVAAVRWL